MDPAVHFDIRDHSDFNSSNVSIYWTPVCLPSRLIIPLAVEKWRSKTRLETKLSLSYKTFTTCSQHKEHTLWLQRSMYCYEAYLVRILYVPNLLHLSSSAVLWPLKNCTPLLQEYYDEACLAVLNNKYQDGIKWHDVACYIRSKSGESQQIARNQNKSQQIATNQIMFNCWTSNRFAIVCEDSDQLINLIEREEGVDVRNWTLPAENPVDLNIFNSDLNSLDSDLNSVDLESVESTTKDLAGWYTKSVERAETTTTRAKLQSTTAALDWSDWFRTSKTTTTIKKPTTTTSSGWYIKSTMSAETTTTSGWYIKSGPKTTTIAAKVPEATTTEASYWSNWYYGK